MVGGLATAERTMVLLGNDNLWQAALQTHEALTARGIPYAVAGGVAVCLHGYRRFTADLDLLIRRDDAEVLSQTLTALGFVWNAAPKEFVAPSGIVVQLLFAGDRAGNGQEARLPAPDQPATIANIEGLPALSLAELLQAKIACGLGSLRRTHKDFADVVELIAAHGLGESFARFLHPSVRAEFRELVRRAA